MKEELVERGRKGKRQYVIKVRKNIYQLNGQVKTRWRIQVNKLDR